MDAWLQLVCDTRAVTSIVPSIENSADAGAAGSVAVAERALSSEIK